MMALNKYYKVDFSKPKEDSTHISDSQLVLIMDNKNQIGSVIMRNFR